tara:strand:- start:4 stop:1650 length:1647 start_codon:yes stop_codon:yes gene_type:complete
VLSNRRILSLWFKRLSVERVVRNEGIDLGLPVVIIIKKGNKDIVYCLNKTAELLGLFVGQLMHDTILKCPDVIIRFADLDEDQRFLNLLARWLEKYSPWIRQELPDGILIDITGCSHLFGGEEEIIKKQKEDFSSFSLTVQIGIADTVGAAWALSRYLENDLENFYTGDVINQEARATRAKTPKQLHKSKIFSLESRKNRLDLFNYAIAPAGKTREYIIDLPLEALRLPSDKVTFLRKLGLKFVRDLIEVPRAALARRLGRDVIDRLNQILGFEPEPVSPERPINRFSVRLTLPEPIGLENDFILALKKLVPALCKKLKDAGFGARKIQLQVFRSDNTTQSIYLFLTQPSFDIEEIRSLLSMKISNITADYGIDLIRLDVKVYEPVYETQYVKEFDNDRKKIKTNFEYFLNRVSLRLGADSITCWHPANSHIPEKAFTTLSAMWSQPSYDWVPKNISRPNIFFNTEPIETKGNFLFPNEFKWRGRWFDSIFAVGPERISPEWWLDDPNWMTGVRDYWKVDTKTGERLWLYYAYGGVKTGGWFCQGNFG